jgi:hypothetical protein
MHCNLDTLVWRSRLTTSWASRCISASLLQEEAPVVITGAFGRESTAGKGVMMAHSPRLWINAPLDP